MANGASEHDGFLHDGFLRFYALYPLLWQARKQSEEDIGLVVCKVLLAVGRASMVTPGYKVKRALDSL